MRYQNGSILATTAVLVLFAACAAAAFVWSGAYDIGADTPHWSVTHSLVENLRERSIATRLDDIQLPNLEDPERIRQGAASYSGMCTGCHLAPGVDNTELRTGMYPIPPNLTKEDLGDPRRTFWVIKHGIKLTAMPAWGMTHSDEQMWNMVAFLHKLPGMSPSQYQRLGGEQPSEDDEHMHGDGDAHHAGAANEESTEAPHDAMDSELGELHTHADGTTERHPPSSASDEKPTPVKEHVDDGHKH